jgi:hypothetical protein
MSHATRPLGPHAAQQSSASSSLVKARGSFCDTNGIGPAACVIFLPVTG